MIKDAAAAYCQDKLQPRVIDGVPRRHNRPRHLSRDGRTGPARAPPFPKQYGGPGLNYVAYGLIAREVERVDSGYRSMMSVQSSLVMVPIFEFGTEAQQARSTCPSWPPASGSAASA